MNPTSNKRLKIPDVTSVPVPKKSERFATLPKQLQDSIFFFMPLDAFLNARRSCKALKELDIKIWMRNHTEFPIDLFFKYINSKCFERHPGIPFCGYGLLSPMAITLPMERIGQAIDQMPACNSKRLALNFKTDACAKVFEAVVTRKPHFFASIEKLDFVDLKQRKLLSLLPSKLTKLCHLSTSFVPKKEELEGLEELSELSFRMEILRHGMQPPLNDTFVRDINSLTKIKKIHFLTYSEPRHQQHVTTLQQLSSIDIANYHREWASFIPQITLSKNLECISWDKIDNIAEIWKLITEKNLQTNTPTYRAYLESIWKNVNQVEGTLLFMQKRGIGLDNRTLEPVINSLIFAERSGHAFLRLKQVDPGQRYRCYLYPETIDKVQKSKLDLSKKSDFFVALLAAGSLNAEEGFSQLNKLLEQDVHYFKEDPLIAWIVFQFYLGWILMHDHPRDRSIFEARVLIPCMDELLKQLQIVKGMKEWETIVPQLLERCHFDKQCKDWGHFLSDKEHRPLLGMTFSCLKGLIDHYIERADKKNLIEVLFILQRLQFENPGELPEATLAYIEKAKKEISASVTLFIDSFGSAKEKDPHLLLLRTQVCALHEEGNAAFNKTIGKYYSLFIKYLIEEDQHRNIRTALAFFTRYLETRLHALSVEERTAAIASLKGELNEILTTYRQFHTAAQIQSFNGRALYGPDLSPVIDGLLKILN